MQEREKKEAHPDWPVILLHLDPMAIFAFRPSLVFVSYMIHPCSMLCLIKMVDSAEACEENLDVLKAIGNH